MLTTYLVLFDIRALLILPQGRPVDALFYKRLSNFRLRLSIVKEIPLHFKYVISFCFNL